MAAVPLLVATTNQKSVAGLRQALEKICHQGWSMKGGVILSFEAVN